MVNISVYMQEVVEKLKSLFGQRLAYVGLQGSYLRGEADENSDVDVMTVLDELEPADMDAYRAMISTMPGQACGFISGRAELMGWNKCEVCSLLNSTKDYFGRLEPLLPKFDKEDVRTYIKISTGNMYHELCHRRIYSAPERNYEALRYLYKGAFFILQSAHYLRTGEFILARCALTAALSGAEADIMNMAAKLRTGGDYDYEQAYDMLLKWCAGILKTT